jgi:hypothetical protein
MGLFEMFKKKNSGNVAAEDADLLGADGQAGRGIAL